MVVPRSAGPDEVHAVALAQVRSATLVDDQRHRKVIAVRSAGQRRNLTKDTLANCVAA